MACACDAALHILLDQAELLPRGWIMQPPPPVRPARPDAAPIMQPPPPVRPADAAQEP